MSKRSLSRPVMMAVALLFASPAILLPGVNAPARAQGMSVSLTPDAVEGLIASLPQVKQLADALRARYDVPGRNADAAGAFGAFLTYPAAISELDNAVAPFGFGNFMEWVQVLVSAATALGFAENGGVDAQLAEAIAAIRANPSMPAAQKDMMVQMLQQQAGAMNAMRPPPENIAAVTPYLTELRAALDQ